MDVDAQHFVAAPLPERAVLLLTQVFPDSLDSVNRADCARAIAAQATAVKSSTITGGYVIGGRTSGDPQDVRRVSEAWQVLEAAGLICRDLTQSQGDWWVLTGAGQQVQRSSDAEGEIALRIGGGV